MRLPEIFPAYHGLECATGIFCLGGILEMEKLPPLSREGELQGSTEERLVGCGDASGGIAPRLLSLPTVYQLCPDGWIDFLRSRLQGVPSLPVYSCALKDFTNGLGS